MLLSDRFAAKHGFVFPIFSSFHCEKMAIQHGVDFLQASGKFVLGKAERIYTGGEKGHFCSKSPSLAT